jgi:mannose-6-phosphate isomerase-like protein (cupin superfamily)
MRAMSYTVKNLREVEDMAAKHGFGEVQEARFPREDLEAESIGLAHIVVKPGKRQPFAHRHDQAEEVYLVLSGSGRIKLDDEIVEVGELDAIRMAPGVTRAVEAGDEGITVLAFGPRHAGDAEIVQEEFWED